MFAKNSRYSKVPDVVTIDSKGRTLPSKSLRLTPAVSGTFLHTVEAGDRLDHLAFTYYQQSRKWWRICDANPEFLPPQALLGNDPFITVRFPVTFAAVDAPPPWAELVRTLTDQVGVEDVQVLETVALVDGAEQYDRAVLVTINQMTITLNEVSDSIEAAGFTALAPARIGRTGKPIVIPPDVVG